MADPRARLARIRDGLTPREWGRAGAMTLTVVGLNVAGWVMLAAVDDASFSRLCETAERSDLSTDPRFTGAAVRAKHREALEELLAQSAAHDAVAAGAGS